MKKNAIISLFLIFLFLGTYQNIVSADTPPNIKYQTHVQNIGWQNWVSSGEMSGTSGQAKRLEGIRINIDGLSGSIEYQTHVQSIGWQNWVSNGEMSGTSGQAKRLEGIRIRLTGAVANDYDIEYRTHIQSYGWQNWVSNGAMSGTSGQAKRLEGIEIRLVKKSKPTATGVNYQTHVQSYGWQNWVSNGAMSGTSGQAKRLEGIRIQLANINETGNIEYRTHVQSYGWQNWVSNGAMSGTSGQAKRLEGIEIRLTGNLAKVYDIQYRTHVQSIGWQNWVSNGAMSGTSGQAKRLEGIEIKLVKKSEKPMPLPETKMSIDSDGYYKGITQYMLDAINKLRAEAGVAPLQADDNLMKLAALRTTEMQETGLTHDRPNGRENWEDLPTDGSYFEETENICNLLTVDTANYSDADLKKNIDWALQMYMNSPSHRAALLSKAYDKVGFAINQKGRYGEVYNSINFAGEFVYKPAKTNAEVAPATVEETTPVIEETVPVAEVVPTSEEEVAPLVDEIN